MIEDGFLGSRSGIWRVKERRHHLRGRGIHAAFRRGAAHAEEESTKQESWEYLF
jgi:hypothetical protein